MQKLSVFSFLFSGMSCNNKQLRLEYCSCLSNEPERLSIRFVMFIKQSSNVFIFPSFFSLFFSYSSKLFEIKSITFVSFVSCFLPLIFPFFISFAFSKILVICFSTFLIQLKKTLTKSIDSKLSVNALSGTSLALRVFRFHSFNFLAPSSWIRLPLRSLFFEYRSKYSLVSVRLIIIPTFINCMQ